MKNSILKGLSTRQDIHILRRMLRAACLNREVFRELWADQQATGQAVVAVLLVGLATGIGTLDNEGLRALPGWVAIVFVGWLVWVSLAYLIGEKLFRDPSRSSTWPQLARALGFAQSPGLLRVVGIVSSMGVLVSVVAIVWQFVAMVVALREVWQLRSYWQAIAVLAISFMPFLLIVGGLSMLLLQL